MKRTPLQRRTPLRRTTRRVPDTVRAQVRARSQGRCEVFDGWQRCEHRAVHQHHRLPRGKGGPDTVDNLLDVCLACHERIHFHDKAWARREGWLLDAEPVRGIG